MSDFDPNDVVHRLRNGFAPADWDWENSPTWYAEAVFQEVEDEDYRQHEEWRQRPGSRLKAWGESRQTRAACLCGHLGAWEIADHEAVVDAIAEIERLRQENDALRAAVDAYEADAVTYRKEIKRLREDQAKVYCIK